MTDVVSQKKILRQQINDQKKLLTAEIRNRQAKQVFDQLEQQDTFIHSDHMLCYWSLPDELPTHEFMNKWYRKKNFYLPKVVGVELSLHLYKGESSLSKGAYGIWEPTGAELLQPEVIDVIIVPGVAFAASGNRMGRGGGYYDRLLPKLQSAYKVGVGFNFQLVEGIPTEPHDINMDCVITGRT
ncbi:MULTISPECIES: 5-formyltetrahydrofolate cyclo-ligase [unclassified Saccharicrinis]|uniref:5-formyltetrahydrofolate cyclo-ligase n=1 Tax=unclassified Saccharicrinis TaxID=2646859 RepID=UPI003D347EFC